jgi:hypothetical protein
LGKIEEDFECLTGPELLATAGCLAVALVKCMDRKELAEFCELLGLLRHDIDVLRFRKH